MSKGLTPEERSNHLKFIATLFIGGPAGFLVMAFLDGAPPLRNLGARMWSGLLAMSQIFQ